MEINISIDVSDVIDRALEDDEALDSDELTETEEIIGVIASHARTNWALTLRLWKELGVMVISENALQRAVLWEMVHSSSGLTLGKAEEWLEGKVRSSSYVERNKQKDEHPVYRAMFIVFNALVARCSELDVPAAWERYRSLLDVSLDLEWLETQMANRAKK